VTEGEDKPLKYPTIFNTADLAILTKMDLAEAVEFDMAAADANIQRVRPGMPVLKISAKNGAGMSEWLQFLDAARDRASSVRRPDYQKGTNGGGSGILTNGVSAR
jgi:hydrogenase nickel incorporation protein HypB